MCMQESWWSEEKMCFMLNFASFAFSCMTYYLIDVFVIEFNACMSNPCQHSGQCDNTSQGFQCIFIGYDGVDSYGMYCATPGGVSCTFHRNKGACTYACMHVHAHANLHCYVNIYIISDYCTRDDTIISILKNC